LITQKDKNKTQENQRKIVKNSKKLKVGDNQRKQHMQMKIQVRSEKTAHAKTDFEGSP